eukprot:8194292-Pyramimonas_sp.AAC.1
MAGAHQKTSARLTWRLKSSAAASTSPLGRSFTPNPPSRAAAVSAASVAPGGSSVCCLSAVYLSLSPVYLGSSAGYLSLSAVYLILSAVYLGLSARFISVDQQFISAYQRFVSTWREQEEREELPHEGARLEGLRAAGGAVGDQHARVGASKVVVVRAAGPQMGQESTDGFAVGVLLAPAAHIPPPPATA